MWIYPPEFRDALAGFGLMPTGATEPGFVRDALNDLYRYELRRLRVRYLRQEFGKPDYHTHVIALRKKYWPLTLQAPAWEKICAGEGQ